MNTKKTITRIALPSYRRVDVCENRTVATLERLGINRKDIDVFVADEEDRILYKKKVRGVNVILGKKGLAPQRKFYHGYYNSGDSIVNVDDDIFDLKVVNSAGKLERFCGDIRKVIDYAFHMCRSTGARLWGVSPFANAFYMKRSTSIGLRYICGIFHGTYAGDCVWGDSDRSLVSSGEDFETTLRSFTKHGRVIRLDWLCPITKYFAEGGIQSELGGGKELRRMKHDEALQEIAKRHSNLATCYKKAGDVTNLRLRRLPSTKVAIPPDLLKA
jgi:hypothetical protein